MAVVLGCVADDLTGATDLALVLSAEGMPTVVVPGLPHSDSPVPDAPGVVVALKSRTAPAADAVAWSRQAARWLTAAGASRLLFKYCSTFDSTDAGNIGPVAEALRVDLGTTGVAHCPAYPANGRTVYQGHLFVGPQLLSASPMRHHPLTPMTDADLVAVLGRQLPLEAGPVGRVVLRTVTDGADALRRALDGHHHSIVDALDEDHLRTLAAATADHPLRCGGAGMALGLPAALGLLTASGEAGTAATVGAAGPAAPVAERGVVLVGSQSAATGRQVELARGTCPVLELDPLRVADDPVGEVSRLLSEARANLGPVPVVVAVSANVAAAQARLGVARAARLVEEVLGRMAVGLVAAGADGVLVAGGESAGAVVGALGVPALRVGRALDPGVAWAVVEGGAHDGLLLCCKSGNFGGPDLFTRAFEP